jgi:hypothetical protein
MSAPAKLDDGPVMVAEIAADQVLTIDVYEVVVLSVSGGGMTEYSPR